MQQLLLNYLVHIVLRIYKLFLWTVSSYLKIFRMDLCDWVLHLNDTCILPKLIQRSRRYSDSSSSSSSSESSSSDDEDRESRKSRSKSKRRKKEKKHQLRSRLKQSTSDDEADGPLPLSRFFGSIKS